MYFKTLNDIYFDNIYYSESQFSILLKEQNRKMMENQRGISALVVK